MQMSWETNIVGPSVCVTIIWKQGQINVHVWPTEHHNLYLSLRDMDTHTHTKTHEFIYISCQYYIICTIHMWLVQPLMPEAPTLDFHLSSSLSYYKINTCISCVKYIRCSFPSVVSSATGVCLESRAVQYTACVATAGILLGAALTAVFDRHLLVTFVGKKKKTTPHNSTFLFFFQ